MQSMFLFIKANSFANITFIMKLSWERPMKLWLKKIPTYLRTVLTQEQVWKLRQTALEGTRMTQGERERSGWSVRTAESWSKVVFKCSSVSIAVAMPHIIYRFWSQASSAVLCNSCIPKCQVIRNCFLPSSLPCFPTFCHSTSFN